MQYINMGALATWEDCDANADWIMTPEQREEEVRIIDEAAKKHKEELGGKADQGPDRTRR